MLYWQIRKHWISIPMCCLFFSQNPSSTDVWKQFIVWMCDLWGVGGENQWQLFKSLFVLELDQDCIYDPSYPILYPTWKRECCYWRWWCVDDDDLMKWVNHFESNLVADCSILNVLLCSSATNSPTNWLLFLYPSLRFGNVPKSVKTIARQWSDVGCSPKAVYLCGHPRHHRRYHTYSTKVGRQVTVVPCRGSVSDHLVISTHTWKDSYSLNYCTQDRSAYRCQI